MSKKPFESPDKTGFPFAGDPERHSMLDCWMRWDESDPSEICIDGYLTVDQLETLAAWMRAQVPKK